MSPLTFSMHLIFISSICSTIYIKKLIAFQSLSLLFYTNPGGSKNLEIGPTVKSLILRILSIVNTITYCYNEGLSYSVSAIKSQSIIANALICWYLYGLSILAPTILYKPWDYSGSKNEEHHEIPTSKSNPSIGVLVNALTCWYLYGLLL